MTNFVPGFGLMGEFENAETLLDATRQACEAGYTRMDAYTPFPVEGLPEMLGVRGTRLPWIVLAGGVIGALVGFGMQYYASVFAYPINVAGRPLNSWPAFIAVTFEVSVLFAAFSATLGMFALNGLPQPYHPVFNVRRFAEASRDVFFLVIETADPHFHLVDTEQMMLDAGAVAVYRVER